MLASSASSPLLNGTAASVPSENWDDDFIFQVSADDPPSLRGSGAPARINSSLQSPQSSVPEERWSRRSFADSISWDEEEEDSAANSKPSASGATRPISTWVEPPNVDFGDYELGSQRSQSAADKTVRSRNNRAHDTNSTPPVSVSIPHLPPSAVSLSSTAPSIASSSHSPVLARSDSNHSHSRSASALYLPLTPSNAHPRRSPSHHTPLYSSYHSAHSSPHSPSIASTLALRPTLSGGTSASASLSIQPLIPTPASPPRPRRRLRKKSRPSHMGSDPLELQQRRPDSARFDTLGSTGSHPGDVVEEEEEREYLVQSNRLHTPSSLSSPANSSTSHHQASSPPPTSPQITPIRSPLFARIGSMKKWNRVSRPPSSQSHSRNVSISDVDTPSLPQKSASRNSRTPSAESPPAPAASTPQSSRSAWLFRAGQANFEERRATISSPKEKDRMSLFSRRRSTSVVMGQNDAGELSFEIKNKEGSSPGSVPRATQKTRAVLRPSDRREKATSLAFDSPDMTRAVEKLSELIKLKDSAAPESSPPQVANSRLQSQPPTPRAATGRRSASASFKSTGASASGSSTPDAPNSDGVPGMRRLPVSQRRHQRSASSSSLPRAVAPASTNPPSTPQKINSLPPVPTLPSLPVIPSSPDRSPASTPTTPQPPQRMRPSAPSSPPLLPPIELSPPSPPHTMGPASGDLVLLRSQPTPLSPSISASLLTPLPSSQSSPVFTSSPSPSRLQIASISPGKSFASLGRTAASSPLDAENSPGPPRRSSLGDLKIPARITMAQTGLRNNLGMVREFATNVDQLKRLQDIHRILLTGHYATLTTAAPPAQLQRADEENLSATLQGIEDRYALWWECADLLIELGGGEQPNKRHVSSSSPRSRGDPSDSRMHDNSANSSVKSRERAITLSGGVESSSPGLKSPPQVNPSPKWRASTGRSDLSQRQLALLRDMLSSPDPASFQRLSNTRNAVAHTATASMVTLPSTMSSPQLSGLRHTPTPPLPVAPLAEGLKKRRASKGGLAGIRELLRSLKRHPQTQAQRSTTSVTSTTPSEAPEARHRPRTPGTPFSDQLRDTSARTSLDGPPPVPPVPVAQPHPSPSPYNPTPSSRRSPRRPSLASIFRLGQNSAGAKAKFEKEKILESGSVTEEDEYSDWDRVESCEDHDQDESSKPPPPQSPGKQNQATVKGRRMREGLGAPYSKTSASQSSLHLSPRYPAPISADNPTGPSRQFGNFGWRPRSRTRDDTPPLPSQDHDSTPQPLPSAPSPGGLAEPRLALTPENIRPLLEYAKEVSSRLKECVEELQAIGTTHL